MKMERWVGEILRKWVVHVMFREARAVREGATT